MTRRERLLTAKRRGQPDRAPIHIRGVNPLSFDWRAEKHESHWPLFEAVLEQCDPVVSWAADIVQSMRKAA